MCSVSGHRHTNQLCINLGGSVGTGRNKCRCWVKFGSKAWFSLVFPTHTQKMSSKSANILFDDMFTLQDVDRARFERGTSSIRSTFHAWDSGIENLDITSFPASSSFLKLWNGSVFGFPPRIIPIEANRQHYGGPCEQPLTSCNHWRGSGTRNMETRWEE